MKRIGIAIICAFTLYACGGSKEQMSLEEALVAKLKDDQDLKDYKLDPAEVAHCVVNAITDNLPGFAGDPNRTQYFEAYAQFVSINSPTDAEVAVVKYKDLFGDIKKSRAAANNVTDFIMTCMGSAIEQHAGDPQ